MKIVLSLALAGTIAAQTLAPSVSMPYGTQPYVPYQTTGPATGLPVTYGTLPGSPYSPYGMGMGGVNLSPYGAVNAYNPYAASGLGAVNPYAVNPYAYGRGYGGRNAYNPYGGMYGRGYVNNAFSGTPSARPDETNMAPHEKRTTRTERRGNDMGMMMLLTAFQDPDSSIFGIDSSRMLVPLISQQFASVRNGLNHEPTMQDFMLARMVVDPVRDSSMSMFDELLPFMLSRSPALSNMGGGMGAYALINNNNDFGGVFGDVMPWLIGNSF